MQHTYVFCNAQDILLSSGGGALAPTLSCASRDTSAARSQYVSANVFFYVPKSWGKQCADKKIVCICRYNPLLGRYTPIYEGRYTPPGFVSSGLGLTRMTCGSFGALRLAAARPHDISVHYIFVNDISVHYLSARNFWRRPPKITQRCALSPKNVARIVHHTHTHTHTHTYAHTHTHARSFVLLGIYRRAHFLASKCFLSHSA